MTIHALEQPVARGSAALVWTLIARSIGLTACVAVALLVVAALLSLP
jgi:hypothetical protein